MLSDWRFLCFFSYFPVSFFRKGFVSAFLCRSVQASEIRWHVKSLLSLIGNHLIAQQSLGGSFWYARVAVPVMGLTANGSIDSTVAVPTLYNAGRSHSDVWSQMCRLSQSNKDLDN